MKIIDLLEYVAILALVLRPIMGNIIYNIIIVLFLCVSIIEIIRKNKILINKYEKNFIVFIIFSVISLVYSIYKPSTNYIIKELSINFITVYLIMSYIKLQTDNKKGFIKAINCFAIGTTILSIYLLIVEFPTMPRNTRLGAKLFEDYGTYMMYSYYLIISTCYIIWKIFFDRKNFKNKPISIKLFDYLQLIIMLIADCVSGTRKCIICVAMFLIIIYIYKYRKDFKKIMLGILLGVLLFSVSYNFIMKNERIYGIIGFRIESMIGQILDKENSVEDESMEERTLLKKLAIQAFVENPILGCGMNNFAYYSYLNDGPMLYAHSNYLELMASGGIIATIIYYFGYAILVIKSYKSTNTNDSFSFFIFTFLIMNLISDYSSVSYYRIQYMFLFVLFSNYLFMNNLNVSENMGDSD